MCGILDEKMDGAVKDILHAAADCVEISLCADGNCVRLNGIYISLEGLNECCMKNRSGYQIAASEMEFHL